MAATTNVKPIRVKGDFILVARKHYEVLAEAYEEEKMTPALKRALARAEKNHRMGKTISLDELRKKLGIRR